MVVERLEKMEKDKKLTKAHIAIWDNFVGEKPGDTAEEPDT